MSGRARGQAGSHTTTRTSREDGRILIWALAGMLATFLIVLGIIGVSRLHLQRTQLGALGDIATATAAAQLDRAEYYAHGLVHENMTAKPDPVQARSVVEAAIAATQQRDPRTYAELQNVQITGLQVQANGVLHVELQARATVANLGLGMEIATPIRAQSDAIMRLTQ